MAGRPLKFQSVEALESMIDGYFIECDQNKEPYLITGLALWLDTSRETLLNYEDRPEFFDTIKRAKLRCENWVEKGAMMNKINATSAIFNLKNNYGWHDRTETDLTSKGDKLAGATINILKPNGNSIQADSETVSGVGISN
jgi:hypothetical protein